MLLLLRTKARAVEDGTNRIMNVWKKTLKKRFIEEMCLWSLVRLKWIIRDDARGMTVGRWMVELQEAERAASSALSLVQWGGRFGSFPSTFDILQTTLMSQDKVTSQHGVIMMS